MRIAGRSTALALALAAGLLLTGCSSDPAPQASPTPGPTSASPSSGVPASPPSGGGATKGLYVALGDSLAAGFHPGSGDIRETAYPALAAARLEGTYSLKVENLACSGETTTSLIKGGKCTYAAGSQLAEAEKVLTAAKGEAALVTIDIGGNDVLGCARSLTVDQACATKGLATLDANLPGTLSRLRKAAGPGTPVLVLGYYNPWVAAAVRDPGNPDVAKARAVIDGLNDRIAAHAKAAATTYVSVDDAFSVGDKTPEKIEGGKTLPAEVAAVCRLTYACTVGDIHLTDEGAATVAGVVAKAARAAGVG